MKIKAKIMDQPAIERALMRISHEIVEKNNGTENIVLVGIKRRGIPLANKIALNIKKTYNVSIPVGYLDISLYRDDLSIRALEKPEINSTNIASGVDKKNIILVDDVLYTGRTVRAAIDALFELGRPNIIQLAVLIDRGHRELPIRADYVGKNVPTSLEETVAVHVTEIDGEENVILI